MVCINRCCRSTLVTSDCLIYSKVSSVDTDIRNWCSNCNQSCNCTRCSTSNQFTGSKCTTGRTNVRCWGIWKLCVIFFSIDCMKLVNVSHTERDVFMMSRCTILSTTSNTIIVHLKKLNTISCLILFTSNSSCKCCNKTNICTVTQNSWGCYNKSVCSLSCYSYVRRV